MAADWTPSIVEARLAEAAWVLKRMPEPRLSGYFSTWPEFVYSFADKVGQEPQMRRPRPGPRQITEADEAMLWLRWLERDDARIVWLRANHVQWKKVCWEVGLSRPAANRHWQYGIAVITWRLWGRVPSSKRSKRFVVENADNLSRKIIL